MSKKHFQYFFSKIQIKTISVIFTCFFILIGTWASGSQKEENGEHEKASQKEFSVGHIFSTDKEITIPKSLVRIIEEYYIERFKETDSVRANLATRSDLMTKLSRRYLNFNLFLSDQGQGVLRKDYHFKFSRGGGVIDLSEYLGDKNGKFLVKIEMNLKELQINNEDYSRLKVFFLSRQKKREILGQSVGTGCYSYFDISQFFHNKLSQEGIVLNAGFERYLSIIGGSFFFFYSQLDSLYLGSLTFIDRRYPEYECGY